MSVNFGSKFGFNTPPKAESSFQSGARNYTPKEAPQYYEEQENFNEQYNDGPSEPVFEPTSVDIEKLDTNTVLERRHALWPFDYDKLNRRFSSEESSIIQGLLLRYGIVKNQWVMSIPTLLDIQHILEDHVPSAIEQKEDEVATQHAFSAGTDEKEEDDDTPEVTDTVFISDSSKALYRILLQVRTILSTGIIGMVDPRGINDVIPGISGNVLLEKLLSKDIILSNMAILRIPSYDELVDMFVSPSTALKVRDYLVARRGHLLALPNNNHQDVWENFLNTSRNKLSAFLSEHVLKRFASLEEDEAEEEKVAQTNK